MSGVRSIALGVVLGGLVPVEGFAAPEPSPETSATSSVPGLGVWVAQTGPEGERIRGWVEDEGRAILSERNPPLESVDVIRVALRGGPYDYQIHIALVRRQRMLERQPEVIVCECGSDEMLERVGAAIRAGADRLAQVAAEERAALAAAQEEQESPLDVAPVVPRSGRWRPSALGIGGIAAGGVGVIAVVGGITMMAAKPQAVAGRESLTRNWRPPGVVVLAIGAPVLAAGVAMLVVDAVQCRKSETPRRCRSRGDTAQRELGFGPSLETAGGGVSVYGRF